MSFQGPNLAREPFVNLRPIRRAALLLWLAASALAAWNTYAYLRSGAGAAEKAAELEGLNREIVAKRQRLETLDADLRRADLERANLRTLFLNDRIAERAFSWNLLLDRLVETMPRGVRVRRLTPEGFRDVRERRVTRTARGVVMPAVAERRVLIQVEGEAEDGEALLELIDRMFAHPAFDRPNLAREARAKSGTLEFSLEVGYLPAAAPAERVAGARGAERRAGAVPPVAAATEAAGQTPRVVAAELPGAAPGATPGAGRERSPAGAERQLAPPGGAPASGAGAPAAARAAGDETPAARPRAGAAPAPARGEDLSIFGVPRSASPYASGGGQ